MGEVKPSTEAIYYSESLGEFMLISIDKEWTNLSTIDVEKYQTLYLSPYVLISLKYELIGYL